MEKKNNILFVFGAFLILSFFRALLNNVDIIINIIAGINIIAFWYVFYLISGNSISLFNERIGKNEKFGGNTKIKKKKFFSNFIKAAEIIILILGLVYIIFFSSAVVNDIISLGTLFLSLESTYLSEIIEKIFYKIK